MFRKLLLSGVLGIATLTGLALTPSTAEARTHGARHAHFRHRAGHVVRYRHDRHYRFVVSYLDCGQWRTCGSFYGRAAADRAAERYRCRGFAVRIGGC